MNSKYVVILSFLISRQIFSLLSDIENCDYSKMDFPCGDKCLGMFGICNCENERIYDGLFGATRRRYCCTPDAVKCKMTNKHTASCSEGDVQQAYTYEDPSDLDLNNNDIINMPKCNGKCYNDYNTSKHLGLYTHYTTCPDKFVYWSALCRGVSFCDGDVDICGEDL